MKLVFTAKDPLVLGIGFAATRDLVSFFKHAEKDDAGTPNPLAKKISYAIGQGSSQSGNFIRSFINLGFNEDESGKIVWDGAMPHIAGRQIASEFALRASRWRVRSLRTRQRSGALVERLDGYGARPQERRACSIAAAPRILARRSSKRSVPLNSGICECLPTWWALTAEAGHSAARQCPQILFPGHHARRRRGRI